MTRVLNQDEIDAMVSAARDQGERLQPGQRAVKPCSFRQAGQLTGGQTRAISALHEGFARSLTQSLGAYLRVIFEATLTTVEQLAYSAFLERVPEVTYLVSFHVPQMNAAAAMQIDHSLIYPLVDILLGGTGQCEALTREVSEIEEQIMDGVVRIIIHELAVAWTPFAGELELEGRQPPAQIQRFLAPTEKTLCLTFEVKLAETKGNLNLVLPVSISNSLLRKLSSDVSYGKPRISSHASGRLTELMKDCPFPVMLSLTAQNVPIQTLMSLSPDEVCNLGVTARTPASLAIAGRGAFEANPVRSGRRRAAQIRGQIAISKEERRQ
jgi:flagellar motor switch protein FliM